jgi:hypothetical protein
VDTAAIITAASVLLTAAVAGFIAIRREIREARAEAQADIADVHKIVNQQRTDMLDEIKTLKKYIRSEGGDPEDAT